MPWISAVLMNLEKTLCARHVMISVIRHHSPSSEEQIASKIRLYARHIDRKSGVCSFSPSFISEIPDMLKNLSLSQLTYHTCEWQKSDKFT
ncbi:unnamed protein product [Cylicocyclus nassatus]|uniref:Uncharacterized protein n=1 Tax=Cylicocyclus nassatus TaxID=53992 RepID=A0AA36HEY5_CYLNA|nr:unnamed protein product [Cylicocyclus nassatus]